MGFRLFDHDVVQPPEVVHRDPPPMTFSSANGSTGSTAHTVRYDTPGTVTMIDLSRALYSPNSRVNLISSGAMKHDGVVHNGINDKPIVKETNRELT